MESTLVINILTGKALLYDMQQKIFDLIQIVNNNNDGLKHYNLFKYLFICSSAYFVSIYTSACSNMASVVWS